MDCRFFMLAAQAVKIVKESPTRHEFYRLAVSEAVFKGVYGKRSRAAM